MRSTVNGVAATLLILTGTSALAQDEGATVPELPGCGGMGRFGEWVGGDASGSDLTSVAAAIDIDGNVPSQGPWVHAFTISEPTDVRLEVAGRFGGDPHLRIVDEIGNEVIGDDDSGGHYAARIETTLRSGRYCALASSVDGSAIDAVLRLGRQEHEALTVGTPAMDATNASCEADDIVPLVDAPIDEAVLVDGVSASASVAEAPAYRFTLAAPTALTVTGTSAGGDPSLRLLDLADGRELASNDDADGYDSRMDLTDALPAGDYCIEVQELNGSDAAITVRVAAFDRAADRQRRIDAAELSPLDSDAVPVQPLGRVQGTLVDDVLVSGARASWARFEVPEDGLVVLEAIGGQVDPVVVLFDAQGRRIAENDDGPNGRDSFLARRLSAGNYLMAVHPLDHSANGYVRVVLERYVPAR